MASVTDDPASSASCGPLSAEEIAALAADFPHFEHAFVYGSALVAPASGSIPMTDLVFAVREAEAWHALNLEKHAAHYSPLGMLGPRAVAAVQERAGAGVYYNAYVPWRGRRIKYGVVSVSALLDDLRCWRSLYLAGRMHKPVQTVKSDPLAAEANLASAAAAALLMQPPEGALLRDICSLSYTGDPRQASRPSELTATHLETLRRMTPATERLGAFSRPGAPALRAGGARRDAAALVAVRRCAIGSRGERPGKALRFAVHAAERLYAEAGGAQEGAARLGEAVRASLGRLVSRSSTPQTVKGFLTGGAVTTARYVGAKLAKRLVRK
ncbi:putative Mmp 37, mitochondrial import protein [Emiliania huxleyi CCMP1516]|uniref:Phosphatidate cytidylyltransferase, mitochondrial n=2 Tax=Emiliania huxleyi TaxID=2903 RepID=A0A0D3K268_EMIH1|nr:putative Mmp 37, mitochondrial import protein [Emiliania huxleyi CCMP1516]EOD29853.1 putative Mmp 37, mitochondrial import protein [Emiliania huxleyi CCMP1516]|eukprot:XP_005782282.1 putative Mmp 37, mitochondrial import protein [Emiliania huxleyi CCMP1516]